MAIASQTNSHGKFARSHEIHLSQARGAAHNAAMKSAYELAMERLNKTAPTVKLTDAQKREIAELESRCRAKIAEREIALQTEMTAAHAAGDAERAAKAEQQLVSERRKLLAELEEKKDQIRRAG